MAGRTLTYFVSDVHLGLNLFDPADREARFVAFLKSLSRTETSALYLLGDIWDFWYEYRDVVPKGFVKVFAQLMDLVENGVNVYFFQGNHDIWCYNYFESLGMKILQQPYQVEIAGKQFCLGHGDALGPGFKVYKAMRWTFRNPFFQWCFSALHPNLAFRLGCGWSTSSRKAKFKEYVFQGESEPLWKFSTQWEKAHKTDYFVFGHFHVDVNEKLPGGARLIILKDWFKSSPYYLFNETSMISGYFPKIEK